jgi:hypothetical protein
MVTYSTVYVEFTFLYLKVAYDEKQGGSARGRLLSSGLRPL